VWLTCCMAYGLLLPYVYHRHAFWMTVSDSRVCCCSVESCCVCGLAHTPCYSKITEAEAAVSVNEKKWLVMHMHVQLKLDELQGAPNPWLTVT
jgi:hypothetical protein